MNNENQPRPSEVFSKLQEKAPEIDTNDAKKYVMGVVQEEANSEGRVPTISDYKEHLKILKYQVENHPEALIEAINASTYYRKLESLIEPEILPVFNDRLSEILSPTALAETLGTVFDDFEYIEDETMEEMSHRILSNISKLIDEKMSYIFNDSRITDLFPDDPVLLNKLKEYFIQAYTGVALKMIGPDLASIIDDIEDSNR